MCEACARFAESFSRIDQLFCGQWSARAISAHDLHVRLPCSRAFFMKHDLQREVGDFDLVHRIILYFPEDEGGDEVLMHMDIRGGFFAIDLADALRRRYELPE